MIRTPARHLLAVIFLAQALSLHAATETETPKPPPSSAASASSPTSPSREVVHLPVPYMRQPDGETCFPTSLLMALHYMGREPDFTSATVQRLHKRCHYDRYNAPAIARDYGLYAFPSWLENAWTRETIEDELRHGRPVVLGVDVSRPGHFVLAIGYTSDGKVIINDPDRGGHGYKLGGPDKVVAWEDLNWRNGIILRPDPFPEPPIGVSGTLVDTTYTKRMRSGDTAIVQISVKNNGREPWPEGVVLAPVEAYTSPTRERVSPFNILKVDTSTSPPAIAVAQDASTSAPPSTVFPQGVSAAPVAAAESHIRPARERIVPGEITTFTFALRAPETTRTTVLRENFNLLDTKANRWFSSHWQTGPSNRQIALRIAVDPHNSESTTLPLIESKTLPYTQVAFFPPELKWQSKFPGESGIGVVGTFCGPELSGAQNIPVPPPDATSGTIFLLRDYGHPYNAAWVGGPDLRDYTVTAWVYHDYRPDAKARGWERVGIFARSNGHNAFNGPTETESADAYAISIDSDDGKLRTGNFFHGGIDDFRPRSTFMKQSGWYKLAIKCEGTTITYSVNDQILHVENDIKGETGGQLLSGECGVFYVTHFDPDSADTRGVRFAGFRVE